MAIPAQPARGRKTIKRGLGKRIVEGKSFRLADEVRYIQRRAADYDSRIVTIGQLILFSTKTGDAWLLDPADQLAAFIVQLLEPVEAVPAIPQHLAGLTDVAELLGQFQQPYLHADDLLLLYYVVVSVHAGGRAAVPALGENRVPPPGSYLGRPTMNVRLSPS